MRKSTQSILTFAALALCAVFVAGCSAKAKMARHQQRADSYYAAGDFSKAEVEYLIALRLDVNNPHTMNRLADIYYQQGRFGRAFPYVKRASELASNNVDMQVKLGSIYIIMRNKGKEAREVAERILQLSPTNSDAPDLLAESISARADIDPVQKRLEAISKQVGDTAGVELAFGVLDYAKGDLKASEVALQRAITLDPKSSSAYYTLGNLCLAQNRLKEADDNFKKAADLSPMRSPKRLSYANFKIQTGEIEEGKKLIDEITKQAPDFVPAWIRSAEIALVDKRFDECDKLLARALALDTDNFEAMFLRGRMYLASGQVEKAVTEMSRMGALYDHVPEVQYQLALSHLAANDQTKAAGDLSKALALRPGYPDATIVLAGLNIAKGDAVSAINSLTQIVRRLPRFGQAYMLLGNAYMYQKETDRALEAYTKAAEIYPKNPQIQYLTGSILAEKKNIPGARKAFEKALELSPKYAQALEGLVNLDLTENNYDAALARVNKIPEGQIGYTRYLLLAKIYMTHASDIARKESKSTAHDLKLTSPAVRPDVDRAEAALLKAIDTAPDQASPYLLLGQLYVSADKTQAALDRLNGLVGKTNNAAAYVQLGMIYDAMKDYPKARDAYEKSIAIRPDFVPALNNLSYLYTEHLVDLDKASTLAEKALQLSPDNPSSADTLGWIVYKKGDYARARGLLEQSAAKLPDQPEVQLHLGLARYMLGDQDAARTALQQAASSTQDFPGKEEASRRLAMLAIDPNKADAKMQADLESRLKDEPNDPIAADRLGAIYERSGSLDKAVKIYEQSLKQDPQNGPMMSRLAHIYLKLNEPAKALDLAKEAHKLVPNDAAISGMLGRLVFLSGDFTWAASLLQDAATKLPNNAEIQYGLAWSYYSIGRVNDAEKTMQGATPGLTGADQVDAKEFLTMVDAARKPSTADATQAGQILGTNADYVPAMMVSAIQAEQQNKADDARKLYSKALARYPAFAPAARNLTMLSARHPGGDDQKVYELGVKARTLYPDDAELTRALGVLSYRTGDYARAAQLLQDSSRVLTNDGEVCYYLGMAHYKLNHPAQTKTQLKRALTLNLQTPLADDARKVLAQLK
jgi:tetratricopeptide (TPR) repeat protein